MVSIERRAARAVAIHAPEADQIDFLAKLGLIDPDAERDLNGRRVLIEPDYAKDPMPDLIEVTTMVHTGTGAKEPPLRNKSTVPEGLRNLAPVQPVTAPEVKARPAPKPQPEPKVVPLRKTPQKRTAEHVPGTMKGRAWHVRQTGEDRKLCPACRDFYNASQRQHYAERQTAKRQQAAS